MTDVVNKDQLIETIDALTVDGEFSQKDVNYLVNYLLAKGSMTGTPRDLMQIRRGNLADLPNLAQGELGFTLDTEEFFVGGLGGNVQLKKSEDTRLYINVYDPPKPLRALKGDGSNENGAIHDLVEYASLHGFNLKFPKGVFRINTRIDIDKEGLCIDGSGEGQTIFIADECHGFQLSAYHTKLTNFTLLTIGTHYVGIEINKNHHILQNLTLKGYTDNDYFEHGIHAKGCWYSLLDNVTTFGGPYHTADLSYNRGYGVLCSDVSVNNKITNSTFLNHEYCVYVGDGSEGWLIDNNVLINFHYGVHNVAGYYITCTHNIMDMAINNAFYSSGKGSVCHSNFIAQHYYSPYTDNPTYLPIFLDKEALNSFVQDNIINTSIRIDAGVKIDSDNTVVTGNSINWCKIGIIVNGNSNTINSNNISYSTINDIVLNGNFNKVLTNTLSSTSILQNIDALGNETQNDIYYTITNVAMAGEAYLIVDVTLPEKRFPKKASMAIIQSADSSQTFLCSYAYDDQFNSPENIRFLIRPQDGTTLPTGSFRFSIMAHA